MNDSSHAGELVNMCSSIHSAVTSRLPSTAYQDHPQPVISTLATPHHMSVTVALLLKSSDLAAVTLSTPAS